MGSKFGKIRPGTYELAALGRLEKSPSAYNGRNIVTTLVQLFSMDLLLADNKTNHKSLVEFEFCKIPSLTSELAAFERLKIDNVVTTLAPSIVIVSSSVLQVTRTTIKSQMGSKFGQIRPWTV